MKYFTSVVDSWLFVRGKSTDRHLLSGNLFHTLFGSRGIAWLLRRAHTSWRSRILKGSGFVQQTSQPHTPVHYSTQKWCNLSMTSRNGKQETYARPLHFLWRTVSIEQEKEEVTDFFFIQSALPTLPMPSEPFIGTLHIALGEGFLTPPSAQRPIFSYFYGWKLPGTALRVCSSWVSPIFVLICTQTQIRTSSEEPFSGNWSSARADETVSHVNRAFNTNRRTGFEIVHSREGCAGITTLLHSTSPPVLTP